MKNILYLSLFMGLLLTACGPNSEELVGTDTAIQAAMLQTSTAIYNEVKADIQTEIALSATATPFPSPTFTASPEATSPPAATPTATPTPEPAAQVVDDNAFLRVGPGTNFRSIRSLEIGEVFTILGITADWEWVSVPVENSDDLGWLSMNAVDVNINLGVLPILESPATPLPERLTLTIINNSSRTGTIILAGEGSVNRLTVEEGLTKSIPFTPGSLVVSGTEEDTQCMDKVTFFISANIVWTIWDNQTPCANFPLN